MTAAFTAITSFLLRPASAHAQGGVPLWTNIYPSGVGLAIAVDSTGNVFVTGHSYNGSSTDIATIKYSNAGVPLWTNHWLDARFAGGFYGGIAADRSGNVLVTATDTNGDYATIKYSNAGESLWTNRYDGPGNWADQAIAITVDSHGDVIVTGRSANGSSLSNLALDYATIKYSSDGVPLWTNRYDGLAGRFDEPSAIAVDGSGNVFVTGSSETDDTGVTDFATLAYSSAGDLLWENRYNGPGNGYDSAWAMAVDSDGNVFVTGNSVGADYATIKYSSAGAPLWTKRYNGPANSGQSRAIAVDGSGNVFVTGTSQDSSRTNPDWATTKYSSAGVPLWTRRYGGPGIRTDVAHAIAVDSSGNVIVTGESYNNTISESVTLAYSSSGVPLWTNRISGGLYKMVLDSNGNVFVTGDSYGPNHDYVTINYSSSVPLPRLDFQKLNNQLVLSWTNAGFNLQTAPAVTVPFTKLPTATSPYTNPFTAPQQFFRLIAN